MNDSKDSDSDLSDEYETLRRRNIAEKEQMFAELGLNNVVETTKEVFNKLLGNDNSETRDNRKKSIRKSAKYNELLPTRRSVRIENRSYRRKCVRGFKGFREVDISTIDSLPTGNYSNIIGKNEKTIIQPESKNFSNIISANDIETGHQANERISSSSKGITVRFPWHQKLFAKISSKRDGKKNEDPPVQDSQNSDELCEFEANERLVFADIIKYSTMIKSYENHCLFDDSDSDNNDDDWDFYEKVEFYISTSEDESVNDSDYDSYDEKEEKPIKTHKKIFARSSAATVPRITPDDVTEEIIRNIARRGTNKIYDPENGTTCHQCRQKTSDTKTVCRSGRCIGVRGMFCGVCLPNRYGESVENALRNPEWECPVCRGICNCSFCRSRAGKLPTGILYPVVKSRGYKNVAEFLKQCDKENDSNGSNKKKRKKIVGTWGEV